MSKVTTRCNGDNSFEVVMGDHRIVVDSPETWGGHNLGPMPPQLFMASIGSCVAVLVNHFCDQHNLCRDSLSVDVDYDKADHPVRFTNIRVTVNMPDTNCPDDITRKALQHVAEHCPVHETIATMEKISFVIRTASGVAGDHG